MRMFQSAAFAAALGLGLASAGLASAEGLGERLANGPAARSADAAVEACLGQPNSYGPVELVGSVEDGVGDTLVWLKDREGDLWACNADGEGAVFAYLAVGPDLLQGQGVEAFQRVGAGGGASLERAAELCLMVAGENAALVSFVDDGFGDALAWVRAGDGATYMCNASTQGALYAFEAVGAPINGQGEGVGAPLGDAANPFPWQV